MKRQQRRGYSVDKVAMVALPLLLLLFFLMYSCPKNWFNSSINFPEATLNRILDLDGHYGTILLKNGKCALAFENEISGPVLKEMIKRHRITLTAQQIEKFSRIKVFGGPVATMPQFINTHPANSDVVDWKYSIPIDSTHNELTEWICVADKENRKLHSDKLRIALLCDKDEPYSNIRLLRDALSKDSIKRVIIFYNVKRTDHDNGNLPNR